MKQLKIFAAYTQRFLFEFMVRANKNLVSAEIPPLPNSEFHHHTAISPRVTSYVGAYTCSWGHNVRMYVPHSGIAHSYCTL